MAPTRNLLHEMKRRGMSAGIAAGFGWYYDDGHRPSGLGGGKRSVAKLRIIVPIWLALVFPLVVGVGLYRHRRYGIRSILLAAAGVAAALWFLAVPAR
jgi:hypothetical protein